MKRNKPAGGWKRGRMNGSDWVVAQAACWMTSNYVKRVGG